MKVLFLFGLIGNITLAALDLKAARWNWALVHLAFVAALLFVWSIPLDGGNHP